MMQLLLIRMRVIGTLSMLAMSLTLIVANPAMAQEIAVIVNNEVAVSMVSAADIKKIFLGKKTTWDSGEKIVFAVCEDPAVKKAFLKKYVKKSVSQYNNYWKSKVFSGTGNMPASFKSKDDAISFVSTTHGAISFVPAPADAGVKTISVQ